MSKPKRQLPQSQKSPFDITGLKFWAAAIKELGIPAFIVFFLAIIFVTFASPEQKSQFIDEFFLLKNISQNPFPFSFVILVLLLVILLQYIYYNKIIRIKHEENQRLGIEKSELQEKLLNKKLNSSQEKTK